MGSDWLRGCFKPVLPASRALYTYNKRSVCAQIIREENTKHAPLLSLEYTVHRKNKILMNLLSQKLFYYPYIFLLCKCQLALPSNFTVLHNDPAVPQDHFGSDASFEKQRQLCNDCTCVIFICKHARCTTVLTVHSCNCTQHQRYIMMWSSQKIF